MKTVIGTILTIAVLVFMIWGSWNFKRHINYSWSYRSQVQQDITKAMNDHIARYHSVTNK